MIHIYKKTGRVQGTKLSQNFMLLEAVKKLENGAKILICRLNEPDIELTVRLIPKKRRE